MELHLALRAMLQGYCLTFELDMSVAGDDRGSERLQASSNLVISEIKKHSISGSPHRYVAHDSLLQVISFPKPTQCSG